jgi:Zn-dependent metalloprotease
MRRFSRQALVAGAVFTATVAIAPMTVAAAGQSVPSGAAIRSLRGMPTDLVLVKERVSLLGRHQWYRQTYRGLPVLDGYYARHTARDSTVRDVDGRVSVSGLSSTTARLTASAAVASATAASKTIDVRVRRVVADKHRQGHAILVAPRASLVVQGGASPRLVWRVLGSGDSGSSETLVDATTGTVLTSRSLLKNDSGSGKVFVPNPSVTLRRQDLVDANDANQTVFNSAYSSRTLTDLDSSGYLRGRYAQIVNPSGAYSATKTFSYARANGHFEQVMAYFHITRAQRYIQGLGFTDVNRSPQRAATNTIPDDNSFYDPSVDKITFGRGGVDDAEDAEIIWHELGHAIQDDQVPGFGASSEAGAIGEGFGDYWAVTMSTAVSAGYDLPCVGDWDAVSYTTAPHCLRRVDGTKTTADVVGEVHDDGEIWSRALWDINQSLGQAKADQIILESQFSYAPDTSFAAAATQVVATAQQLEGPAAATACRKAFTDRKIL